MNLLDRLAGRLPEPETQPRRRRGSRSRRRRAIQPPSEPFNPDAPQHTRSFVSDCVTRRDERPEAARDGRGYIHASSLIGCCPRKMVLDVRSGETTYNRHNSSTRLMWAYGRAAEEHIRESFIKSFGMENVWGMWSCSTCSVSGHNYIGLGEPEERCSGCNKKMKKYNEAVLIDHHHRLVGSPDLVYKRPDDNRLRIVEIKSKAPHLFEPLMKAETDHVLRTMLYREMLIRMPDARDGLEVDDAITVLYANKGYHFSKNPFKEYQLASNGGHDQLVIDLYRTAARIAAHHEPDSGLPTKLTQCTTPQGPTAKNCSRCAMCFNTHA